MVHSTFKEKFGALILKIKTHPILSCLCVLLLISFLIFAYTHPLVNAFKGRTVLPKAALPAGTFTLTTEPEAGMAPVLEMIKNASQSIDLVMYEFEDKQIADALIDAEKRGVSVRVILNQGYEGKPEKANEPAYAYLEAGGVPVHWAPNYFALTHQKTLITDKNETMIMTFNFTPEYYDTSRDFGLLDTDQNDVTAIENTFDADWNDKQIGIENADDLVWSPHSESDMLLIIQSAKKELDIYNEEMEDTNIIDALEDAVKKGIDVNVIMTYQTADKDAFNELKNAGVHVSLFHGEKGLYIHAKVIIADDSYAFLGSENFSYSSLEKNRELGIFISDQTILNSLMRTFNTDWVNAKEF